MTKPQPALLPEGEGGREPGCCSGADLTPYRKCFSVFTGVRFNPGSREAFPASRQESSCLGVGACWSCLAENCNCCSGDSQ